MKLSQNITVVISALVVIVILIIVSSLTGNSENESTASEQRSNTSSESVSSDASEDTPNGENASPDLDADEVVAITVVLNSLEIADEAFADDYDRDEFKHWINASGSDCDVRDAVLKEEANPAIPEDADCPLPNRKWKSLYDGEIFNDPGDLDIDHMVPLAEAWRSGAYAWTDEQREKYANDMGDPRALIAVSAGSNRSKSDKDPDEWRPSDDDYLCTYIADWVAMKYRWQLAVDQEEYDAIADYAKGCESEVIVVPELALAG